MTRINRPDTLLTELRDIKRRLHALETAQRATTTATQSAAVQTPGQTAGQTTAATLAESPDTDTSAPEDEPS